MNHPIPDAALDDRLGIVGTTGSGKTYGAGTCVERIMAKRGRVVIPDPLGVWWGLRLAADGKTPSALDVVVFGGPHADLPISPQHGALIGETVAGMRESAILDLSGFETAAAERRFMLAFLDALYRKASGEPVHLVFDEADLWAPERILDREGDATKLHGMMQTVVRRGRVKGLTSWLISQRPAALSKSVLSQVDGLVAFRLTASQDRKALGAWIEGQADKAEGAAMLGRLPTKARGEAVVWLPARGILADVAFPAKTTWDSSRSPKRGETRARIDLPALDLGGLKERLTTVEAETKANDPKALRAEIARLQRELREALSKSAENIQKLCEPDPAALAEVEQRGYARGFDEAFVRGVRALGDIWSELLKPIFKLKEGFEEIAELHDRLFNAVEGRAEGAPSLFDAPSEHWSRMDGKWPAIEARIREAAGVAAIAPRPAPSLPPRSPSRAKPTTPSSDRPLGAERRPLAVLASVYPAGMTEAAWAVAAGLKRSGGTWAAYVSRLRSAGRIERRGDEFFATKDALLELGDAVPAMPPPGPELVEFWAGRIPGAGPMLRELSRAYPRWLTRDDLGSRLGLAVSGGTFSAYLSRLRSPGLIETDGQRVRAAASLVGGER